MAEQLVTASIAAPGFYGINTQDSGVTLESGFATVAENCVIDKSGRIGSRKGWVALNTTSTDLGSNPIKTVVEVVKADGNVVISAGNNKLFTGTSSLTQMVVRNSDNTANLSYTITDNHWQVAIQPYSSGVTASAHAYIVQTGHAPLVYHKLGTTAHAHTGSYGLQRLADIGVLPAGYSADTFKPNIAISAFGRVWYAGIAGDEQTVYFSDLNDGSYLNGGTAGYLNIADVVPDGDPITALAAHNNFLVIFCKKNIVVYSKADTVSEMALSDQVKGIGCIARDSIAGTGTDLVFLSDGGVRSLLRTIQEKTAPLRDVSKNVRDDLMINIDNETIKNVKAAYFEKEAFYLISFPSTGVCYAFDMRDTLPNGAARPTLWRLTVHSMFASVDRKLYFGMVGYLGDHTGYKDNQSDYRLRYYTNWFNFAQPTTTKVLKKLGVTFIGGRNTEVTIKWSLDYSNSYNSTTYRLADESVAEYGTAEYGEDEYTAGVVFDNQQSQLGGSGSTIQLGVEVMINGSQLSIQKMDCYIKQGRIR
jgi:hypothetical protein